MGGVSEDVQKYFKWLPAAGRHLIKSWFLTQALISLSSCKAEFYGAVKAGGVSLGNQSLLKDRGCAVPVRVRTDSTATFSICGRQVI